MRNVSKAAVPIGVVSIVLMLVVPLPAALMDLLIGLNLVISVLLPGISWQVHVGGLLTGAAVGAVYTAAGGPPGHGVAVRGDRPGGRASAGVHAAGLALLAAVLTALTLSGAERLGMSALMG